MEPFAYTKNYDNIALFDKRTRRFTFVLGDGGIYSYDAVKKARRSLAYVGTPIENAFANIGRIGAGNAFSSGSEKVQERVKLFFTDGTFTYGYISGKTLQKGSLEYHDELARADDLIRVLLYHGKRNLYQSTADLYACLTSNSKRSSNFHPDCNTQIPVDCSLHSERGQKHAGSAAAASPAHTSVCCHT